ncbi:hypothetical protein Tco_0894830 [Tanacetum coccineum]|uniref:Uncharacterized protein n=1 Tax=Tanacetum coccineum TaxID=301880 RepID=A0ABQ5CE36_9ASTR
MRRFHGMDDAKEIWEAIRTRFGGNANSKKMQKAVFKQQFEAFKISNSEGLEKGYDRFQQLLSQLEAHGAEVSTEDANHKFLRSLPSAWSNLAMTMRTNPEIDNLSIDDLYNNLRVFEQEIQGAPKPSSSAQNVAFVSQSKSSTNKVKSGFSGAYSSCTPSTSSTNVPEKEVLAGFADEVIYSLFAKQTEDLDLLHEDLEQIDDRSLEAKNMDIIGNREYMQGNILMKEEKEISLSNQEAGSKEESDGLSIELGDQEAQILAYSLAVKKLEAQLVTSQKQQLSLNEKLAFQANEIHEKDEKLKRYRRIGMKAVKEKEQLQTKTDGFMEGILSRIFYEEEINFSIFKCSKEDSIGKPSYSRFTKSNDFKGVPPPLSGDYTPQPQEEIDDAFEKDLDGNTTEPLFCDLNHESLDGPK